MKVKNNNQLLLELKSRKHMKRHHIHEYGLAGLTVLELGRIPIHYYVLRLILCKPNRDAAL